MPRLVSDGEKQYAIFLMTERSLGQRDIERETGLSRPYIRKLAREIGHQFPRNGIEIVGRTCMCTNCGMMFRKPPSKVERAKNQFCDDLCRKAWMKGPNHPSWKVGKTASTFSSWAKNQQSYEDFKRAVLERDGYKCVISGKTDNLEVHHIMPKAEGMFPELAFDPNNGITLNVEVHKEIHDLIRDGKDFEDAIEYLKNFYNKKENTDGQ